MSSSGDPLRPVRLVIVARVGDDGALLGFVPDAALDGALVEVSSVHRPRTMLSGTTDAMGTVTIELPGPDSYRVSLTHNVVGGALLADAEIEVGEAAGVDESDHELRLTARTFPTPG